MASKRVGMFNELVNRMMEVLPDSLKSNMKMDTALVDTYNENNTVELVSFTVDSGRNDDRWVRFEFVYSATGEAYIKQTMGSIDGGSVSCEPFYRLDPDDVDSSMDEFISTVFIPKVSSVFRVSGLEESVTMERGLNDVLKGFVKYLREFTDGMDVIITNEWDGEDSCFVMKSVDIHDRDKAKSKTLNVDFLIIKGHIIVQFDTESITIDKVDETSMYNLEALVRDVINNNFSEGLRNMDRED